MSKFHSVCKQFPAVSVKSFAEMFVLVGVVELAVNTSVGFAQDQPEALMSAAEQSVDADDYAKATDLLNRATAFARQSRNADIQADIQEAKKRVGVLDREFKRLKSSRDTLMRSPSDGSANTDVGSFYSFAKEDWGKGLKLLANGEESTLRDAARMDLLQPKPREHQMLLADKWVAAAEESRDGMAKHAMHLRARQWYLEALAQCETDAERTAVAERLDKLQLYPTKVVIWNTHNGNKLDRGSLNCNVLLLRGDKVISQRQITLPWARDVSVPTVIRPTRAQFDQVRIEVKTWQQRGGGLAELEVYLGKTNLARGAFATASAAFDASFTPDRLTDGNTGGEFDQEGIWLLPDNEAGWVQVHLNRR